MYYIAQQQREEFYFALRKLLVDEVPCMAGKFAIEFIIFKLIVIFLDRIDHVKPWMTRETHFTIKTLPLGLLKSSVSPPLAACDIYGRLRIKILLFTIVKVVMAKRVRSFLGFSLFLYF